MYHVRYKMALSPITSVVRILILSIIVLVSAPAKAADDHVIMQKLYSTIAETFPEVGRTGPVFLIVNNPGIVIDPWIDDESVDDLKRFSRLLNTNPGSNWLALHNGIPIDQIYETVLSQSHVPVNSLTTEQRAELAAVRQILYLDNEETQKSLRYTTYLQRKTAYETANAALEEARRRNDQEGTNVPVALQRAEAQALQEWSNFGFKTEIETALERYEGLKSADARAQLTYLSNRYRRNKEEGTPPRGFVLTTPFPSLSQWDEDSGWVRVRMSAESLARQATHPYTRIGDLPENWKLWRKSVGSTQTNADVFSPSSLSNLSLDFELKRVELLRPWMDSLIFRSTKWRWPNGSSRLPISTGGSISTGVQPEGDMPFLPRSVLLARRVRISASWSRTEIREIRAGITQQKAMSWGPFALVGRHMNESDAGFFAARRSKDRLQLDDVQVIGWFCDVLPKSPNPDPALIW